MEALHQSSGIVVLTTHERSGYFTSVLGEDIDLRCNPRIETSLPDLLHNIIVAGGRLAVLDESFFMDTDELANGLELFFREETHPERLKLIVVCTQRSEGDSFLAFLVMYCGIYNIIYGKTGVDVSLDLDRLMKRDNTRFDVLHLAEAGRWSEIKQTWARGASSGEYADSQDMDQGNRTGQFEEIHGEYVVDVKNLDTLSIQLDIAAPAEGL